MTSKIEKAAEFDMEDEIGIIVRKYNDLNTAIAASNEFVRGFHKALELAMEFIEENSHIMDHTDFIKYISKLKEEG